ncbi:endonuclease/exonuclease/phosphatase family protein [Ensifer adhaerens]|uniref:endonuclease/exonuclease/phosphatase family protein n=1 Tax=Ensifer adhaerens TaxID=106592 RepID=UPI001F20F9EB|nr:endonuclease/exonuclease/phosphatase family protein [Ensifer adhaerens]
MTYNVHSCVGTDRCIDPKRVADVIASCDADVIALQELDVGRQRTQSIDQAEAIAEHLQMRSHFHPAFNLEEELYGDAVLTAHRSELVRAGPLPSIGEPRGALWVEIHIADRSVNVVNTHLGLRRRERIAQANALLGDDWLGNERCVDKPTAFVGDLNAVPGSGAFERFSDVLFSARVQRCPTFPSRFPILQLDHVMHNGWLQLLSIETVKSGLARLASDHLPLLARFSVKA